MFHIITGKWCWLVRGKYRMHEPHHRRHIVFATLAPSWGLYSFLFPNPHSNIWVAYFKIWMTVVERYMENRISMKIESFCVYFLTCGKKIRVARRLIQQWGSIKIFPQKNENENCEYSRNIISHLSGFQIFHSHFFPHYRGENIWTITLTELVHISTCVWYFNLSCSFDGSRKKELRAFETLHMMFILTFLMRICLTSPTFLLKYISTKSQLTKKYMEISELLIYFSRLFANMSSEHERTTFDIPNIVDSLL